ncbi:MAG: hypothetical protein WCQ67_00215 [Treponema sp.]
MAEEKELTGIERELVLQYLRDDNVPVTVTLEDKPKPVETEVKDEKVNVTLEKDRVPLSEVFPVAIKAQQMTVLDQGIILLKNDKRTVDKFLGKNVRVQFYFNRVGLYFITTMKECSAGLALVVPSSIKRIVDVAKKNEYSLEAELSFVSEDKSVIKLNCVPSEMYKLFVTPKWGDIDLSKQKDAKFYLEKFVDESKKGQGASIGNGVHLFPVCKYLTDDSIIDDSPVAVVGLYKPLDILYVDDKKIVLGSREEKELLQLEADYKLNLNFTLEANHNFKRRVNISCSVENEYSANGDNNARCFVCKYTDIKEEDTRFLYERFYGKKLD